MLQKFRIHIGTLLAVGVLSFSAVGVAHASAPAGQSHSAVRYASCTAINRAYPHGIARPGTRYDRVNGINKALKGKPYFSAALYAANKRSDRDKDGIACER